MRIAFVLCGDLASVSGGFLYDRQLIGGLRAAGAVVDVVSLPWWRSYGEALAANLMPWPFEAADYDVIVQDQLCHAGVFLRNAGLRRTKRVPVISLVHNLTSTQPRTRRRGWVRACERAYFDSVDGVIAVCGGTLDDVRALRAQRWTSTAPLLASPGADHVPALPTDLVAKRGREDRPLRLLNIGLVAPHKGVHRLLPILSQVEGVTLDVAGGLTAARDYVRHVRREIAHRGLSDRVTLHGQLDPDALANLRAGCDVFVMPSDREAYPIAALEGFAAGLPALLTDQGGTAEVIGGSAAGRLLPPDDEAAWAAAITSLARDRQSLSTLAHAALARHAAHVTWGETARRVHAWLGAVTRGSAN
ncbi:MAG TPA: glycosyltransferase family 4 protein [Polyangia bacterium]